MRVEQVPVLTLAYIGDAVFELYVRRWLLQTGCLQVRELHQRTVALVRAGGQAQLLARLAGRLTPEEEEWIRRGRNAKATIPRTAEAEEYRLSTGLEALLGYLYLTGREDRVQELLASALKEVRKEGGER